MSSPKFIQRALTLIAVINYVGFTLTKGFIGTWNIKKNNSQTIHHWFSIAKWLWMSVKQISIFLIFREIHCQLLTHYKQFNHTVQTIQYCYDVLVNICTCKSWICELCTYLGAMHPDKWYFSGIKTIYPNPASPIAIDFSERVVLPEIYYRDTV